MDNKRLLKVFNLAHQEFYNYTENMRHKSLYWERYNKCIFNESKLVNFRETNGIGHDLDDSYMQQYSLENFKAFFKIKSMSEEYFLKNMLNKNIGNSPYCIFYKNHYLDSNKIPHILWYKYLIDAIPEDNVPKTFCEIGGGFGSLSQVIINNLDIKLLSIDLPESNLIKTYYLKEIFPEKKFFLYDNYHENKFLSVEDFNKNDIIILPPNCNIDERIKLDLFINTRSMMEMNFDVISYYFQFIQNKISENGYFLNINRYEKRCVEGEPIRISEYPYDKDWKVIQSGPLSLQKHVHYLLTQRTNIYEEKNIQLILQRIHKFLIENPALKGP